MRRTLLPTALLALLALVACNADRSGGGGAPAEQPPPATEAPRIMPIGRSSVSQVHFCQ